MYINLGLKNPVLSFLNFLSSRALVSCALILLKNRVPRLSSKECIVFDGPTMLKRKSVIGKLIARVFDNCKAKVSEITHQQINNHSISKTE